jgi:hypothetical protein
MESRVSGSQIIEAARRFIGVPFRHRGRNIAGLDCAGLVIAVYRHLNLMPNDFVETLYNKMPTAGLVEKTLSQFCTKKQTPEIGNILMLSFLDNPCHMAFFADDTIIHAYNPRGKVVEEEYSQKWENRLTGIYDRH